MINREIRTTSSGGTITTINEGMLFNVPVNDQYHYVLLTIKHSSSRFLS